MQISKENVLTDEQVVGRFQAAVKLAIEKQKAMGIDTPKMSAYMLSSLTVQKKF